MTQAYTYQPSDVKSVNGGYDVKLVFEKIAGDTQGYNPDKNNSLPQARKQAGGWQIGLTTTDTNGVMGGVEFK